MGGIVALSAIVLGGTLGAGMSMPKAVLASLVGSFILAVLSAASCVVGAKTGLSTSLVSRFVLGRYGSYEVSVIVALSLFGWFTITGASGFDAFLVAFLLLLIYGKLVQSLDKKNQSPAKGEKIL